MCLSSPCFKSDEIHILNVSITYAHIKQNIDFVIKDMGIEKLLNMFRDIQKQSFVEGQQSELSRHLLVLTSFKRC